MLEACANVTNNIYTHGTSGGGKYYSYIKPGTAGQYSLTVVNSGTSNATFAITGYSNGNCTAGITYICS